MKLLGCGETPAEEQLADSVDSNIARDWMTGEPLNWSKGRHYHSRGPGQPSGCSAPTCDFSLAPQG